jgi:uncharacterized protein (DUF58 family)
MRLTRSGWSLLVVGLVVLAVARTVQVPQIWMIGASFVFAVLLAAFVVAIRPHAVRVSRTVAPAHVDAGTAATITFDITASGRRASPASTLVAGDQRWRLASLPSGTAHTLVTDLPTEQRGIRHLAAVEVHRSDLLGLAARTTVTAPGQDVVIGPRRVAVHMGHPGAGALGAMMAHRARQFGLGEFEGLRHYVEGDDLRLVHWKASARSADLLVKQFSVQGATRCMVVLDTVSACPPEHFETNVSIVASLLHAAHESGMSTRLVTTGGIDAAGGLNLEPHRRLLATVTLGDDFHLPARDPSDGLGLMICVTPHTDSEAWRRRDHYIDPLTVAVAVTRESHTAGDVLGVSSLDHFAATWNHFAGLPASPSGRS